MTGFVSSSDFVRHDTGPGKPERPDRLRAIHRAVRHAGLVTSPDPFPDFVFDPGELPQAASPLVEIAPVAVDEATLRLVHDAAMIDRVRALCAAGGGVLDDGDTVVSRESFELAKLSAGAAVTATEAVLSGRVKRAFAAARPPGHHATPGESMGFCLFANLAIAVRVAQQKHGVGRVAVVDFDVHHGNGTQAVFDDDPTVFFVSLHQHPATLWPGSGFDRERGFGLGEGFTLNVPLMPQSGDDDYLRAIDEIVLPQLHEFGPEMLFISAGFDAHTDDPLANMNVSEEGFGRITRSLVNFADGCCAGRVVSVLEGGYDLHGLSRSVVRHLIELQNA